MGCNCVTLFSMMSDKHLCYGFEVRRCASWEGGGGGGGVSLDSPYDSGSFDDKQCWHFGILRTVSPLQSVLSLVLLRQI